MISTRGSYLLYAAAVVVAALLWSAGLGLRPLHSDEAGNYLFMRNLVKAGTFQYDPGKYHGPSLFFLSRPLAGLFKAPAAWPDSLFRLVPVAVSSGSLLMLMGFRRRLGVSTVAAAACLLATSPGYAYYARYFIHEPLLVFCTASLVASAFAWWDSPGPSNNSRCNASATALTLAVAVSLGACLAFRGHVLVLAVGFTCLLLVCSQLAKAEGLRYIYVLSSATTLGVMVATKETAIIPLGVLVLSVPLAWAHPRWWVASGVSLLDEARAALVGRQVDRSFAGVPGLGLAVSFAVVVLYFSSFFRYPQGLSESLKGVALWFQIGQSDHLKPITTYLQWLVREESPVLILSICSLVLAFLQARRAPILIAFWSFGTLLAYSIIPYKTPWLLINCLFPMALLAGWGLSRLPRLWFVVILACAGASGASRTVILNFLEFDNPSYTYVYSQTTRSYSDLLRTIHLWADGRQGYETQIFLGTMDCWPLPYHLLDFKNVALREELSDVPRFKPDLVIAGRRSLADLRRELGPDYRCLTQSEIRLGTVIFLFARVRPPDKSQRRQEI